MSILASIDFAHPSGVIATIGASEADPPREANGTEPRGLGNCGVTHGGGLRHNALCNPTPVLVSLPGATGGVVQVAAGLDFSLAVTSSGQLYAFGDNFYAELGSNPPTHGPNPTPALGSRLLGAQ